jgi:hypothetical protein
LISDAFVGVVMHLLQHRQTFPLLLLSHEEPKAGPSSFVGENITVLSFCFPKV